MSTMVFDDSCLHFRGDVPCKPHKEHGVHCTGCTHRIAREGRILIIKLGATGDVIRTTPLLRSLGEKYPQHEIWWITQSPDVLPSVVHKRLNFDAASMMVVQGTTFDIAINLDKDPPACVLMQSVQAHTKVGYTWKNGVPAPIDDRAVPKFVTGLFDDVNKANTLSYPEEIFAICGLPWNRQEYVMDTPTYSPLTIPEDAGPVVGLNTGCGDRWRAREWPVEHWISLIKRLQGGGMYPVLLGGPAEHARNVAIAEQTGAAYAGVHPYRAFFGIVNQCNVVVTTVTMALHAAIGLRKHVVLFNNIFNRNEFELYGRGQLIEPQRQCECYFKHECTSSLGSCMQDVKPDYVYDVVETMLSTPV